MTGDDICKLIPIVLLFIMVIVFGIQFLRFVKITKETDEAWNRLMNRLDEIKDE